MCCIFTCCGWVIDLIQRVWVFAMSCCISSAVCCVLITSSMSGVALGYNYSLAEYIDMKETNVSVFIKRGVFDDDIGEDTGDWRRRGHPSMRGFVRDEGNSPDSGLEDMPLSAEQSGRRLDDSILDADSNHKFEGHLMKLTMAPPHPSTETTGHTADMEMVEAMSPFKPGSLDQLKAIQGIINKRKLAAHRDATAKETATLSTPAFDEANLVYATGYPGQFEQERHGRRMMNMLGHRDAGLDAKRHGGFEISPGQTLNPARLAVPGPGIGSAVNWMAPKIPIEEYRRTWDPEGVLNYSPTYPSPITYKLGPVRPITMSTLRPPIITTGKTATSDQKLDIEKNQIGEDRYDFDETKKESLKKPLNSMVAKTESTDYYEEENVRGLPVRKKRSIIPFRTKQPRAKFAGKVISKKIYPGPLTKFKLGKSISNEINDYPSILVSKLHFSNKAEFNETSTNEQDKMNSTKSVEVNVNSTRSFIDSSKDKVLKIIYSMFS